MYEASVPSPRDHRPECYGHSIIFLKIDDVIDLSRKQRGPATAICWRRSFGCESPQWLRKPDHFQKWPQSEKHGGVCSVALPFLLPPRLSHTPTNPTNSLHSHKENWSAAMELLEHHTVEPPAAARAAWKQSHAKRA